MDERRKAGKKNPTYQTQKMQPCHSLSAAKPSVSRRWVTYRKYMQWEERVFHLKTKRKTTQNKTAAK